MCVNISPGLGIYKRKKENTQERKQELVQENTCFLARVLFCVDAFLYEFLFACFRACFLVRVLVFFLACFLFFFYKFPAQYFCHTKHRFGAIWRKTCVPLRK